MNSGQGLVSPPAKRKLDTDRRLERARDPVGIQRLEPAKTLGGEIARDAAHAQAHRGGWP